MRWFRTGLIVATATVVAATPFAAGAIQSVAHTDDDPVIFEPGQNIVITQKASSDDPKLQKELRDLEGQREKINKKIAELQSKLGIKGSRSYSYSLGGNRAIVAPSDVRVEVKAARELANEARAEARRSVDGIHELLLKHPDGKDFQYKVFVDKDGKAKEFSGSAKTQDEVNAAVKKAMEEVHKSFSSPEFSRALKIAPDTLKELKIFDGKDGLFSDKDGTFLREHIQKSIESARKGAKVIEPGSFKIYTPESGDSGLRSELKKLREEIEQLKKEIRRGEKPASINA